MVCLTAWFSANLSISAEFVQSKEPNPASTSSSPLVGTLGRREALVFEGNKTFSAGMIQDALRSRMEFLLAAHPGAPLADYTPTVERLIRSAYRRQGFADVHVQARIDTGSQRVRVQVEEGPRYKTGRIRFVGGAKAISDAKVQEHLLEVLSEGEVVEGFDQTNLNKVLWKKGTYAPFDEGATEEMKDRLMAELANLNFYKPTLQVSVVPMSSSREGDLVVEMVDEGLKGTIDDVGYFYPNDDKKNPDAEMEQYLGLTPGMPLRANLTTVITNRLWLTGRFLRQEASLVPLPGEGHFRLELDLEDLEEAPPLRQSLSTNESTVLKLCDWLNQFPRHPEDLVFTLRAEQKDKRVLDVDLVLSKFGFAWVLRDGDSGRQHKFAYAIVASSNSVSYYAGWRQRKLITSLRGKVTALVSLLPDPKLKPPQRYTLTIAAGVSNEESEQPIDMSLRVAPVKFLEIAHSEKARYSVSGTELAAVFPTPEEEFGPVKVGIDMKTGRLNYCRFEARTNELHLMMEARSEPGGYNRLVSEVSTASATFPNDYVTNYPKSSWLGFVLSDLLESGVLESDVLSSIIARADSEQRAQTLAMQSRQIRSVLNRLKAALGKPDLAACLHPFEDKLNKAFGTEGAPQGAGPVDFYIPLAPSPAQNSMTMLMSMVATYLIDKSDLWPWNSWPWTLAREAGFTLAGQNPYTGAELEKLFTSKQTGPLGCWAAAALLARLNAPLAEKFARRSLEQLTLDRVEMDVSTILAPENAAGQVVSEALSELGQLNESDLEGISIILGTNATLFAQQTAAAARAQTNRTPVDMLKPAMTGAWEALFRPRMTAALKSLLAKVGTPDSPEAAFQRANFILQAANQPQQFSDAARALEFAAEKGLARAQIQLGCMYRDGQGVPQDSLKALAWFTKAADQGEPHAACRVGDMYFDGQGVAVDKAEAAIWYERDARRGCARSQFRFGQCSEQQSNLAQAFAWYRVAATNGFADAQMTLAERLSDDLAPNPDYAEAFLWYRIAADAGNRVAAVSARRAKNKLTPAQVLQIEKEARKITKRNSGN
jgi:hypothetical protein